jgi:hypothetical protein
MFTIQFQVNGTFTGSLASTYMDDGMELGGSTPFTGIWSLASGNSHISAQINQKCFKDSQFEMSDEELPIADVSFSYENGMVKSVVIDDSQSAIDHEEHCEDAHRLVCIKQI